MVPTNENYANAKMLSTLEERLIPQRLLGEIFALINENFIGIFKLEKGAISMQFLNGDYFKLTVCRVI